MNKNKKILIGLIILFGLGFAFLVTYKAQVMELLDCPITCTLMSEHKDTNTVSLSSETPVVWETILCEVPKLKEIKIQCEGVTVIKGETVTITLSDAKTGEIYATKSLLVEDCIKKDTQKYITIHPDKTITDSYKKSLRLEVSLMEDAGSVINITANEKQTIVQNFNGASEQKTNIIYTISYGNGRQLAILYAILCVMLLLACGMCYYFFIWREYNLTKVFVPVAFAFGVIMTFVTMVHGIPDEPDHIDTAYRYANMILFMGDPDEPNTIYKRQCDACMTDMLANGIESNSYYQLMNHFFERPADTDYITVSYADTSAIVPAIVYVPTALGIALGRVLGLSALMTITFGRLMNLFVFVLLIWWAMRIIPYGKNALGMIMLLPIALQQAASASYDPMITGGIVLFAALCLKASEQGKIKKWEVLLLAILTLFIAMTKGGVYLPICLMILIIPYRHRKKKPAVRIQKTVLIACLIVLTLLIVCTLVIPKVLQILGTDELVKDGVALYSIEYVLKHPLNVIYLYWNTLAENGGTYLAGLLGGRLSWLDVKINWLYLVIFWTGLLLLVNIDTEKYKKTKKSCVVMVLSCISATVLIMASMMLAYTTLSESAINGLQGRYFLPLFPCMLLLASTDMGTVRQKQAGSILMVMMLTNIMVVLQTVTQVLA